MSRDRVADFLKNEEQVALYREGLSLLKQSGVLDLLVWMGMPKIIAAGSDINIQASQASWSNGWQSAVENILHLEELYRSKLDSEDLNAPEPTYTSMEDLIRKGLKAEEINKVKKSDLKLV